MHSTAAQHAYNILGTHWVPLPLLASVWQVNSGHGVHMQLSEACLYRHACMQAAIACYIGQDDDVT